MHKSEPTESNHSAEKAETFEAQQKIMEEIYRGGFEKYAKKLPNLQDALDLESCKVAGNLNKCLCCMDERTPYGVHSAGSGILLSDADFDKYFEASGADSISSHTGCGAAKIYAEKMGLSGDPDEIAKEWAKKKAKEKGVPYTHLEVEKLFHFARVCYYDGTGRFNYKKVEGLPVGFVVGRKCMSKEASLAECGVAKNIIFGDHGFGEGLLDKKNPFILVAVAETYKEMEALKKELSELTGLGDKVIIDGFVVEKVH